MCCTMHIYSTSVAQTKVTTNNICRSATMSLHVLSLISSPSELVYRRRVRWKEWKGSKAVEASSQGLKVWSYSCCQRRIFKEWREKLGRSKLWNWRDSRDVNFCQLSISATSKAGDVTPGADGEKIEIQWNVKSSGMENRTVLLIIINSL